MMRSYLPIREQEKEDNVSEATSYSGFGCFKLCCFNWQHTKDSQSGRSLLQDNEDKWLVKKLKGLKQVSEIIAGPKWKNLLRKIGKYFNTKKSKCHFKYDPASYALNFDNGAADEQEERDGNNLVGFSSRFAPPVSVHEYQRTTTGL